jgi:asparagine synthase (glutamine-hydrolysing)
MCGIAAVIGKMSREAVTEAVDNMLAAQLHRGPDDCGLWVQAADEFTVGLGNRRLAIVDLSPLGHQPMVNPDTGDAIAYNGETYNAAELRTDLEASGIRFRSRSDTEVVLRAYERWGTDCFDRLRGMFALAIWDHRKRRLVLARDPVGVKPLYFAEISTGLAVASEVGALLTGGLVTECVDRRALAGYLAYGAVQEPLTINEGVRSLPAGSWLTVSPNGRQEILRRYWTFPRAAAERAGPSAVGELAEECRALLARAVRRHLMSDVPLGVFLSSGVDSTVVAGLATEASNKVHSFTVVLPEAGLLDEGPLAHQTARHLGTEHHEVPITLADAARWTLDGLVKMDQPSMDGLNTYIVSRAVREAGMVVALTGQGGDELFGGYQSFRHVRSWYERLRLVRPLPPAVRSLLSSALAVNRSPTAREKARGIARAGPDLPSLYFLFRRLLSDRDMAFLGFDSTAMDLTPTFHDRASEPRSYVVAGQPAATVARLETVFYLGNTLLRDGDVFGMANSLEIRPPFLDRDVLDWVFGLPDAFIVPRSAPTKFILRQACGDLLREELLKQPKRGFSLPYAVWMQGPLRETREESLDRLRNSGLVDPAGVDRINSAFLALPASAAWSRAWALMSLGYWLGLSRAPALTRRSQ